MNQLLDASNCSRSPRCRSLDCAADIVAAVTRGSPHQTRTFLSRCCPNAAHIADRHGRTALHMAASCGRVAVLDWLVQECQASLAAEDQESGWTALHRSLFYGQVMAAVHLINFGASLEKHDKDDLTPLELTMKDHPAYAEYSHHGPSQAYSWGTNANFTLGHGGGKSRSQPEVVDQLVRDGQSIKQVVMCKFHTVFLMHQGVAFTCGHGQGGRLGHGNEEVCLRPRPVTALEGRRCERVAAARDHTVFVTEDGSVYSCGQNAHHQLGHSGLGIKALTPKLVAGKQLKNKVVLGVAAGRFHSALHTGDALYTFGLNAGQLGHAKGEKYVGAPRKVTTLNHIKTTLAHLATSDAATVCATEAGDIYVLNEYQCRKVASKQFNLLKVVAFGGTLDSDLGDGRLQKQGGSELSLLVLNKIGKVFSWRSSRRSLRRCVWTRKREVLVCDASLSRQGLLVCTPDGEAFTGRFLQRRQLPSGSCKDSTPFTTPQSPTSLASLNICSEVTSQRDCGEESESPTERVSLHRLPAVHRATAVACDPDGLNFAVLQAHPKTSLTELPSVSPSLVVSHMTALLSEADTTDCIHDIVLKVGFRMVAAHKYILAVRSDYFHRLCLQTSPSPSSAAADDDDSLPDVSPSGASPEVHDVTDKADYQSLLLLLQYLYTDTCDLLRPGYDFRSALNAGGDAASELPEDLGALTITDGNRHRSAYGVYKEQNQRRGGKGGAKKAKKGGGGGKRSEANEIGCVTRLIDVAKKFGVASLVKRLNQVRCKDGRLVSLRPSARPLRFSRRQLSQLCDVVLCSEDSTLFPCHKCVLVARLDYFHSMLGSGSGWIEASSSDPLKMPLPTLVLSTLLDFLYTDAAPAVTCDSADVELICSVLTTADQLLIDRLKEICEVALVDSITLRNVAELLEFASVYQADQLRDSCHQYIGLNLACLLEARSLDVLSDEALLSLTKAYRDMIPSMPYRIITPYLDGPDLSQIEEEEEEPVEAADDPDHVRGHKVVGSLLSSDFDQAVRRAKARRKANRRTSTGKRRSVSASEHGDVPATIGAPLGIPSETPTAVEDKVPLTMTESNNNTHKNGPDVVSPSELSAADEPGRGGREVERDSGIVEAVTSSVPTVEMPEGRGHRKERPYSGDRTRCEGLLQTPERHGSRWQSPSTSDGISPDLRTIMLSEASQPTATPKKPALPSRLTTPIAKKSQKQRRREQEQERATDSGPSLNPTSPVEHPVPSCPWGAPTATRRPLSFKDLQEEEQRLMGRNSVTVPTSPPPRGLRKASESSAAQSAERLSPKTSPVEATENPWHQLASSPPATRVSFSEIIKTETEQRETLAKNLKKPFALIQIEERALEELRSHYHVDDTADQLIMVERATLVVATPLWRRSKDGS